MFCDSPAVCDMSDLEMIELARLTSDWDSRSCLKDCNPGSDRRDRLGLNTLHLADPDRTDFPSLIAGVKGMHSGKGIRTLSEGGEASAL